MQPCACAVLCPACPHLLMNLPDELVNAPPESKFLYALFVAIDADFRLAQHNVSSDTVNPGLNHSYTFFVEETAFKSFLNLHGCTIQDKSTCSSHNAVNLADMKASRGLAAIGAVSDLQKGKRYINMDHMFFSSMLLASTLQSKNLWRRMSIFPPQYHLDHSTKTITFLVPKFHLPAHVLSCQTKYLFNFIKGVRRTDGEAPERGWANINPVATSTHEMGPGSRCDTLNNHFNNWNWKKSAILGETSAFNPGVCGLGIVLGGSIIMMSDAKVSGLMFSGFGFRLPETNSDAIVSIGKAKVVVQYFGSDVFEAVLNPSQLASWKRDIEAWELDHSKPNPFKLKVTRLELEDQQYINQSLFSQMF
ncbi:hypothetical protein C8R48DRAFT_673274 [Suillus tomentosus]|nr:hypothetical protein C8R48DRAFT_673274 [Suillus tomentosus]